MTIKIQIQEKIALQGLSPKTFDTYWSWINRYFFFCRDHYGAFRHPKDCDRADVERYLTHLAVKCHVSKASQNVALQALLYMYREVLGILIDNVSAMRSKRESHTRDVISVEEVRSLFDHLDGVALLAAQLMYGCGLRIGDLIGLRLKDLSFERKQIAVKTTKGDKWRYTQFPEIVHPLVRRQMESVMVVHKHDEYDNPNGVSLPGAYRRKAPTAARSIGWYWLFPSDTLSKGHEGVLCGHHRHPDHIGRQIKESASRAGIIKPVTSHILRHSFATHAHEQGVPMRTLMELLGHSDIRTTEIYVHADQHDATSARSPLESLLTARPVAVEPRPLRVYAG